MVYIVLGVVAFLCFAFCIYMLVKVEHEPVKKHKPAWKDDDAEDEAEETVYDLSAKKKDSAVPKKYKKSKLLRKLEIICGIEFVIALILLIWDIYVHSL